MQGAIEFAQWFVTTAMRFMPFLRLITIHSGQIAVGDLTSVCGDDCQNLVEDIRGSSFVPLRKVCCESLNHQLILVAVRIPAITPAPHVPDRPDRR